MEQPYWPGSIHSTHTQLVSRRCSARVNAGTCAQHKPTYTYTPMLRLNNDNLWSEVVRLDTIGIVHQLELCSWQSRTTNDKVRSFIAPPCKHLLR